MKAPTLKLVLNRKYAHEAEGYISLRISVPNTRRYKYRSLGHKIPIEYWDDENEVVLKGCANYQHINTDIQNEKSKLKLELLNDKVQGAVFTKEFVQKKLKGDSATTKDFIAYFRAYLDFMKTERKGRNGSRQKHSPNYIEKYEGYLNRVIEFGGESLSFGSIDNKWMERLETHFSKTMNYETSLPVFISKVMSVLRKAEGEGLFSMKKLHPYVAPSYIDPDRPYLTLEETERWAKELVYSGKLTKYPDSLKVACFFLVECWSGLRFSDWPRFKVERIGKQDAIKVSAKKNGEPVYLFLYKSPRLAKLVKFISDKKIVFDLGERKTNTTLDALRQQLDFEQKVTTHTGRHTCATLLLIKGYSKTMIAEWMGISERTVDIYAKQIRMDLKRDYDQLGGF